MLSDGCTAIISFVIILFALSQRGSCAAAAAAAAAA
jgi:hypothetical protein